MIITGNEINLLYVIHRDLLLNMILKLLNENRRLDNPKPLRKTIKLLEFIVKRLRQDENLKPIKIMGIITDNTFLAKVIALLFSGIFALAQLTYRYNFM